VAEKYAATNVGSLKIFPNPDLESESGWSTEIGLKQGIRIREWNAYADLSVFLTEYANMIEYVFDLYPTDTSIAPSLDDYGFMAMNVGKARITGIEISLYGNGQIGRFPLNLMAGYTFIEPVDVQAADTISGKGFTSLKYRYRHSFKSDAELGFGRFRTGFTLTFNSRMDRIDDVFTDPLFGNIILPGFPAYWEENNTGFAVLDLRVLCNITSYLNIGLMWKNVLNNEYMGRPGDIRPPGNITLRLTAEF
jgi:iron complex outermembrane receptor protein